MFNNKFDFYLRISFKLLARSNKKTFIFIRDIAIPIILIISVSSIIISFNNNLTFLSNLAGQDKFLTLRENTDRIENSFISKNLSKQIEMNDNNIKDLLAFNVKFVNISIFNSILNSDQKLTTEIVGTNLTSLYSFWENELGASNNPLTSDLTID
ncbi:MAG: hypothetical protein ACFFD1_11185, partial [Candidatus Thorarchaeota archaeon]